MEKPNRSISVRSETVAAFRTAFLMFYHDTGIDKAVLSLEKVASLSQSENSPEKQGE